MRIGGHDVGIIGIGAWQAGFKSWGGGYTRSDLIEAYRYAFENGVRFIDTAEIYGNGVSEEIVGEAVKGYDVFIATKLAGFNTGEKAIFKSAESSRRRLGVDVIDLYQLHWPPSIYTSLPRVVRAMERLVDKGVVRYIGVSNFDVDLLREAIYSTRRHEIVSNQVEYSLVNRGVERRLIPFMKENGVALIAYSPLGKGVLAGKTKVDNMARRMDSRFKSASKDIGLQRILSELASKYGVSKASIALAWLKAKNALPIPGVKRKSHVDSILDAMEIRLSMEDIEALDRYTERYVYDGVRQVVSRYVPNILVKVMLKIFGGI